ncbi:hypothetical protein QN372_12470 [Undibacterium sp. RTI2.1]|uniref:hypothetical protein n=1 Tax=unclassified Undibacterium TaxID=2630295 RepID=UPI002B23D7DB|nr:MULTISPECIES: hypothetical protein [unclassified Undibacterium]MEB0031565.1 hypothetical protein [Undibacterium sp. RTI2.1]MEB0117865.1 hypothetical protein [Undibacterium sp. RTI2.2]
MNFFRTNVRQLWLPCLFCALTLSATFHAEADDVSQITSNGQRLTQFLDQTRVEELWPAGVHVAWETGVPNGKPAKGEGKHTHCSAFVAAIAKRLGIYILRPPDHSAQLLANAQYDWLLTQGAPKGWEERLSSKQAQQAANSGVLVVAVYRSHHDDKPGHIAIVRPDLKSGRALDLEGPQITQAGAVNYLSATLAQGFASHPLAWKKKEVRYFSHDIEWENVQ